MKRLLFCLLLLPLISCSRNVEIVCKKDNNVVVQRVDMAKYENDEIIVFSNGQNAKLIPPEGYDCEIK